MEQLPRSLIRRVQAQSGDTIAAPTWNTDLDLSQLENSGNSGGGNNNDNDNGGDSGGDNDNALGEVNLTTTSTNFGQGELFLVDIELDTDGEAIESFTIRVQFDPLLLAVVDDDRDVEGTQIAVNSQSGFTITENETNESTGTITLRGESTSGVDYNDIISTIQFEVLSLGQAEVEVIETETTLVNSALSNILDSTSDLSITLSQSGSAVTTQDTDTSTNNDNLEELPKSNLPFEGIIYMLVGIVLIGLGLKGRQIRQQSVEKKNV